MFHLHDNNVSLFFSWDIPAIPSGIYVVYLGISVSLLLEFHHACRQRGLHVANFDVVRIRVWSCVEKEKTVAYNDAERDPNVQLAQ